MFLHTLISFLHSKFELWESTEFQKTTGAMRSEIFGIILMGKKRGEGYL